MTGDGLVPRNTQPVTPEPRPAAGRTPALAPGRKPSNIERSDDAVKHCAHYSVGYVLRRNPEGALVPLPRLVSEMAWDKFFEEHPDQEARRARMDGITDLVESSICDLVAWEPDSGGVWFSLRGGDRHNAGFYHWYFLWSTKTGMVTVPERVKLINRFAASRWSSREQPLSQEAAAAEEQHDFFLHR